MSTILNIQTKATGPVAIVNWVTGLPIMISINYVSWFKIIMTNLQPLQNHISLLINKNEIRLAGNETLKQSNEIIQDKTYQLQ